MRVLIDYRPALRERTGIGEYTHELVRALAASIEPSRLDLSVFSSSWKDRLEIREPGLERHPHGLDGADDRPAVGRVARPHDVARRAQREHREHVFLLADVALHRALASAIAARDANAAEAAAMRVVGEPPSAYPPRRRAAPQNQAVPWSPTP